MKQSLAYIHPEAKVAEGVEIGPFVTIDKNVIIGEGTKIGSNVTILEGSRIGKNCNIFPGAVIGAIPQDLKFAGEETLAVIGDNTTVRECVTVNRGTASRGKTEVGDNCLLMAYAHVAHDCIIKNNVIVGNATQIAGEVEVDDFAIISGGSLVHQFVRIGAHVMIQGGSKVAKDVPPYVIAGREPLSYFGINIVGLQRRGFNAEQIEAIHETYRVIYNSNLNNTKAIEKLESEMSSTAERDGIIDFIKTSPRGIIKSASAKRNVAE